MFSFLVIEHRSIIAVKLPIFLKISFGYFFLFFFHVPVEALKNASLLRQQKEKKKSRPMLCGVVLFVLVFFEDRVVVDVADVDRVSPKLEPSRLPLPGFEFCLFFLLPSPSVLGRRNSIFDSSNGLVFFLLLLLLLLFGRFSSRPRTALFFCFAPFPLRNVGDRSFHQPPLRFLRFLFVAAAAPPPPSLRASSFYFFYFILVGFVSLLPGFYGPWASGDPQRLTLMEWRRMSGRGTRRRCPSLGRPKLFGKCR